MKPVVKTSVVLVSLLASLGAGASEQLAQKYVCVACHQANQKALGPSWTSIREKYQGGSVTPAQLAAAIQGGSKGKWGAVPMPPQGNVPEADALALATWILQKK